MGRIPCRLLAALLTVVFASAHAPAQQVSVPRVSLTPSLGGATGAAGLVPGSIGGPAALSLSQILSLTPALSVIFAPTLMAPAAAITTLHDLDAGIMSLTSQSGDDVKGLSDRIFDNAGIRPPSSAEKSRDSSTPSRRTTLNGQLKISDLVSKDGSIILFRYISEDYIPGYRGVVTQNTGRVSYTINPLIFMNGQSFGYWPRRRPHILISKQNLSEKLMFVANDYGGELGAKGLRRLSPETRISEFFIQFEVEVDPKDENVLLIMSHDDFEEKMKSTGDIKNRKDYQDVIDLFFSK